VLPEPLGFGFKQKEGEKIDILKAKHKTDEEID